MGPIITCFIWCTYCFKKLQSILNFGQNVYWKLSSWKSYLLTDLLDTRWVGRIIGITEENFGCRFSRPSKDVSALSRKALKLLIVVLTALTHTHTHPLQYSPAQEVALYKRHLTNYSHPAIQHSLTHIDTQPFYSPFSGTTQVSRCQKKSSGLHGAGEYNKGRCTDRPAGCHSIRTNERHTFIPHCNITIQKKKTNEKPANV